jgi:cytochrome c peroxidase
MNGRITAAVITIVATLGGAVWAQQPSVTRSPAALKEIADVEAAIDRIETQTLERLTAPPDNEVQLVELLGKAMLYDKQLSVNRNEACAFCHMPETGFTGPLRLSRQRGRRQTRSKWGCRISLAQCTARRSVPIVPSLKENGAPGVCHRVAS